MKNKIKRTRRKKRDFEIFAGILIGRETEYVEIFAKNIDSATELMYFKYNKETVKMIYKTTRYTDTTLKKIDHINYKEVNSVSSSNKI